MEGGFMSEDREFFYIPDSDGNEIEFEILYEFADDDSGYTYLLLILPVNEDQDPDETFEVYPLRYKKDDDEPLYELVESDEEWKLIEEVLKALIQMEEEVELEGETFREKENETDTTPDVEK